jgi:hypothetical protein
LSGEQINWLLIGYDIGLMVGQNNTALRNVDGRETAPGPPEVFWRQQ